MKERLQKTVKTLSEIVAIMTAIKELLETIIRILPSSREEKKDEK